MKVMSELEEVEKELEEEKKKSKKDPLLREVYFTRKFELYRYMPEKLEAMIEEIKTDPYARSWFKDNMLKLIEKRLQELSEIKKKKLEYVI